MNKFKKFLYKKRIFWICKLIQLDEYYYYQYSHLILDVKTLIFAGYNLRALKKKSNAFNECISFHCDDEIDKMNYR